MAYTKRCPCRTIVAANDVVRNSGCNLSGRNLPCTPDTAQSRNAPSAINTLDLPDAFEPYSASVGTSRTFGAGSMKNTLSESRKPAGARFSAKAKLTVISRMERKLRIVSEDSIHPSFRCHAPENGTNNTMQYNRCPPAIMPLPRQNSPFAPTRPISCAQSFDKTEETIPFYLIYMKQNVT